MEALQKLATSKEAQLKAAESGGLEAVKAAIAAHPQIASLQRLGSAFVSTVILSFSFFLSFSLSSLVSLFFYRSFFLRSKNLRMLTKSSKKYCKLVKLEASTNRHEAEFKP